MPRPPTAGVRMIELLGVLSLVSDLGMGQPIEHALRHSIIARRLGAAVGLEAADQRTVVRTGLLAWVGCHVDAYEQAKWFGDDLALKAAYTLVDASSSAKDLSFMLPRLGAGKPIRQRTRTAAAFLARGIADVDVMLTNHARAVTDLAAGLGLGQEIQASVCQTFERWDGRGVPDGLERQAISLVSRLINLADVVEVFARAGGIPAAVEVARARSGTQFDPELVDVFCAVAPELLADVDALDWDDVVDFELDVTEPLGDDELDSALAAIADFTDVKSPFTCGHSRGVAQLAAEAAALLQIPVGPVRRAALLHDLGRMGVPNSIWDKPGTLTRSQAERVRLHPYLTERALSASAGLVPLARIAVEHHERTDGSGYPRGLRRDAISPAGRVLAAADTYHAALEQRPHRAAAPPQEAAAMLRDEARSGRLDPDAVDAVLRVAGHSPRSRRATPTGLTPREVEVLRLLAVGLSTKQIARRLTIAGKTAANHVEHIYAKLGVSNRAMAALAAARLGLLDADLTGRSLGSG